jgi:hypothetical protein
MVPTVRDSIHARSRPPPQVTASGRRQSTPTRAVARAGAALPAGYASFLDGLKARIRAAQVKAALAVNVELVLLSRLQRIRGVERIEVKPARSNRHGP